jgi:hypothetical protein
MATDGAYAVGINPSDYDFWKPEQRRLGSGSSGSCVEKDSQEGITRWLVDNPAISQSAAFQLENDGMLWTVKPDVHVHFGSVTGATLYRIKASPPAAIPVPDPVVAATIPDERMAVDDAEPELRVSVKRSAEDEATTDEDAQNAKRVCME